MKKVPKHKRDESRRRRPSRIETADPDMRAEYDFHGGQRGKYAARYAAGTNLVALDDDVAKFFHDSESANHALRFCMRALIEMRAKLEPEGRAPRTLKRTRSTR